MNDLIPVEPAESVDKIQDLARLLQLAVDGRPGGDISRAEVIDEDVEVDAIAGVVCGGEGAQAAAEGGDAVVGEDLDDEGEAGIRV